MGITSEDVERDIRRALGVPEHATEVVVVAESTHWDPNWLVGSERYFSWCVRPTLDAVLDELQAQPRRVFTLECLFFVERYWRDRPERRDLFVELVQQRRLRFSGTGVTTPDTLLADDESILRDALIGQVWLAEHGMSCEPGVWYFPDSFGHSPGLPSLVRALGFTYAAICRIDGMRFPGADLESAAHFPRPGTSAADLTERGSADFLWRSTDGSEVVTHWVSQGYGQGDMLASGGLSRALGLPVAWSDRRSAHVDRRVAGYLESLRPLARTPYRFLPIGIDFARPIRDLVGLLDDWNDRHFEQTGTWLVNAALEDYLDLVSCHREALPVIALDPNPYWMGFYSSRPRIKAQARELTERLVHEDAWRSNQVMAGEDVPLSDEQSQARWIGATANHHDFITGTATDWVANGEQTRWLERALAVTPGPSVIDWSGKSIGVRPDGDDRGPFRVVRCGHEIRIELPWGTLVFDAARGGALISVVHDGWGELIGAPSFVLESALDTGGLWRMGHEFAGGTFRTLECSASTHANVRVDTDGDVVEVRVDGTLDRRRYTLRHALRVDVPGIVTTTSVHPRNRRCVSLMVCGRPGAKSLKMHQPGTVVTRAIGRYYDPTFWPLHSFAAVTPGSPATAEDDVALVIAAASPTAFGADDDGSTRAVVARSAVKEIAYGFVPVMAPAWARNWQRQTQTLAFEWADPSVDLIAVGRQRYEQARSAAGAIVPTFPLLIDDPFVEIISVKPADRGPGVIVRLRNWRHSDGARQVVLRARHGSITRATVCDARERDLARGDLDIVDGTVPVSVRSHLTTVRFVWGN